MKPGDAFAFALLGNLALQQGNFDIAVERHKNALELKPDFVVARIGLARSQYLKGDAGAAESAWRSLLADDSVAAAYRIDSAFDLAGVLRGRGQFDNALGVIEDAMPLIREEQLRAPLALSVQGSIYLDKGDAERAETLLTQAFQEAPPPPTRFLFALGMMEVRLGHATELDETIAALRLLSDSNKPDRNEDKAANYLAGLSALEENDLDSAASLLQAAVEEPGYQYRLYRTGLAMLSRAAGDLDAAAAIAFRAATERDRGDLRLDLEIDRARALLLHAEILAELGADGEAKKQARRFLDWWRDADPTLPEPARARTLLDD
jgi:tetratricopeptide (TPR) repeat protein